MNTIVDVKGFKDHANDFIVKEIAIVENQRLQSFLIKPPYPLSCLTKSEISGVRWMERNMGILWDEGYVPYLKYKCYTKIVKLLRNKSIYVKGYEKVLWVQKNCGHNNVFNIEELGCPSFPSLYTMYDQSPDVFSCMHHSKSCALKNVTSLHKWYIENKKI